MISAVIVQCDHCKREGRHEGSELAQLPPGWLQAHFAELQAGAYVVRASAHSCPDHHGAVLADVVKRLHPSHYQVELRWWGPIHRARGRGRPRSMCSTECRKARELMRRQPCGRWCSKCGQLLRALSGANRALARAAERLERIKGAA